MVLSGVSNLISQAPGQRFLEQLDCQGVCGVNLRFRRQQLEFGDVFVDTLRLLLPQTSQFI
jgi:hypothetical protein